MIFEVITIIYIFILPNESDIPIYSPTNFTSMVLLLHHPAYLLFYCLDAQIQKVLFTLDLWIPKAVRVSLISFIKYLHYFAKAYCIVYEVTNLIQGFLKYTHFLYSYVCRSHKILQRRHFFMFKCE